MLKSLVLAGFRIIDVIDMDRIELTNLNRQFLFQEKDTGRPKAEVAAERIMDYHFAHIKNLRVTPHVGTIQSKDTAFYKQFNVILGGLDNIEARRWLNSLLHSLVEFDPETNEPIAASLIPWFDGGTEGFKGQARTIIPTMTSCFECSLKAFPRKMEYPLCTIAENPRLPEHCIEYAFMIQWPREFPSTTIDVENPEHMEWVTQRANERAKKYGIAPVTPRETLGVVKILAICKDSQPHYVAAHEVRDRNAPRPLFQRIVPAVASTNALIAAALVNEAFKLSSYCGAVLNNYLMCMGDQSLYTHTFAYEKDPNCIVCARKIVQLRVPRQSTLQDLLNKLKDAENLQLQRPSLSSPMGAVFMERPESLRKQHEYRLEKTLQELKEENVLAGESTVTDVIDIIVTDPVMVQHLHVKLQLID